MQNLSKNKSLDYEYGLLIQSYRHKARLTQPDLAKLVGVTKRAVIYWEAGNSYPQASHLRRLIEIFLDRGCFNPNEERHDVELLWEKATARKDFKDTFDPAWFNTLLQKRTGLLQLIPVNLFQNLPRQDWSEAIENRHLYGREEEITQIENWIIKDNQRIVSLFGIGGLGKTSLAVSAAHKLVPKFDFVVFRSLQNAPPLGELLDSVLGFLLNGQLSNLPATQSEKVALLMDYLRNYRCLLVLDNLETIMQDGLTAGEFHKGYTDYGDLIQRISEVTHKSCLLITSREKPHQPAFREVKKGYVRSMALRGLDLKACQAILHSMLISSDEEQSSIFTRRYGGNPLALKLISEPIKEIFGGDAEAFLASQFFNYGDSELRYILDQHFERLSPVEQDILYWLAVSREPLELELLQKKSLLRAGIREFADGINALSKRFLIEPGESQESDKGGHGFTLQGVVIEYVTQRMLNQFHAEIVSQTPEMLRLYPLMQTHSREYIRQTQLRVLIEPLLNQLQITLKRNVAVENCLKQLLDGLRDLPQNQQTYAGGNLLNLLIHYGTDLSGWNLEGLALWQTNFVGVDLHAVNLGGADLTGAGFTEANVSAYSLAYHPNGKLLAIGCLNGAVKVWQVGKSFGDQLQEYRAHTSVVGTLAFNSKGTILASGSMDGTIRLWDLESGNCLATLKRPNNQAYIIRSVAFSPDGAVLASAGDDDNIYIWQLSTGRLIAAIPAEQGWVFSVAFSPDGKQLASAGLDGTVKVWNVANLNEAVIPLVTLQGHNQWVNMVAFSPDGKLLASASADHSVRVWSVPQYTLRETITGHTGIVLTIAFSPDSKVILSSGVDRIINFNILNSNPPIQKSLPVGNGAIAGLAFNPDGETFVSCSSEISNVKLWSVKNFETLDILRGYNNFINSIAVSFDSTWLGIGGIDSSLLLWDLTKNPQSYPVVLKGHTGFVAAVAFDRQNQSVATGSSDANIKLWNLSNKKCWRTLTGHKKVVMAVAFSPDRPLLISGDEEGVLKTWSLITGTNLTSHTAHSRRIRKLVFSPNGRTIATAAEDGYLKLWEINLEDSTIRQLAGWDSQSELAMSLAYSQDGSLLYSVGSDGCIRCWNTASGECINTIEAHKELCWWIEVSADGRKLATAGEDGFVFLWNVERPENPELITGFRHEIKAMVVAFSPDDKYLFSAGGGGKVEVWNLESKTLDTVLSPLPPYEGLNITGVTGLTEAQRLNLLSLGALETFS